MKDQLTIHIINELPWSNLNRDDTGLPKRLRQGGVLRGLLSSQSIKRGARTAYEAATGDLSYRSANLERLVSERAMELAPDANPTEIGKAAKKLIGSLTKAKESTEGESGRSAWLSAEEVEAAALVIASASTATNDADDKDVPSEFVFEGRSGALAIAAFGRMFAARSDLQTEAAIAVSPAVSTHATVIESDYFSTVDDLPNEAQGKGATYLGVSHFLNGVFYRSVTIDRNQLHRSWTGIDGDLAKEQLTALITALIYGMPRGKENATAPYLMPALVLAETQAYRVAYDFETPVIAQKDGGFLEPTIARLQEERAGALRFDPDNFGELQVVAGTVKDLERFGVQVANRSQIAELVALWALEKVKK